MTTVPDSGARQAKQPESRRVYLIAGAGGMLGTATRRVLTARGAAFVAPGEGEFDITDPDVVSRRIEQFAESIMPGQSGVLINAAAYTNVERAEDEPDIAYLVNERGPRLLAAAARAAGLGLVHVSTDFVFDGTKDGPYAESDAANPLSVYGASKLAGERAVLAEYPDALIVRTAWVFGESGINFPTKILDAAGLHPSLSVVTDEIGSPTYTVDLAAGILGLVDAGASGLFHLTGAGSCTRFQLAEEIVRLGRLSTLLKPVTSEVFPSKVARPANSVLDCSKAAALGVTLPEWRDGLARFMSARAEASR